MKDCFLAARERHLEILKDAHSPMAEAVKGFFACWQPDSAADHPMLQEVWDAITAGGNLVFSMGVGNYAQDDPEIQRAWNLPWKNPWTGIRESVWLPEKREKSPVFIQPSKGYRGPSPAELPWFPLTLRLLNPMGKSRGRTHRWESMRRLPIPRH